MSLRSTKMNLSKIGWEGGGGVNLNWIMSLYTLFVCFYFTPWRKYQHYQPYCAVLSKPKTSTQHTTVLIGFDINIQYAIYCKKINNKKK